jgi:hypothetical protein
LLLPAAAAAVAAIARDVERRMERRRRRMFRIDEYMLAWLLLIDVLLDDSWIPVSMESQSLSPHCRAKRRCRAARKG